jgi:hypothetical protein
MEHKRHTERTRVIAQRQAGRITTAQLLHSGLTREMVRSWRSRGILVDVARGVYSLGHVVATREGDLWTAILYAGPGAMLSHATAAHWRGLIKYPPRLMHVSTPRLRVRPGPVGLRVHRERDLPRELYNGIPVTTVAQTMLDLASGGDLVLVRRALAQLDFRKELDVRSLEAVCGPGWRGSRLLREALADHQPRFAYTNEELEARFLIWCERWKVPIPIFNARVQGILVDAYWPEHKLVVELDGRANHSSPAQRRRDRQNELVLREHGLTVVRYDWALLHDQPAAMHRDLLRQMGLTSDPG